MLGLGWALVLLAERSGAVAPVGADAPLPAPRDGVARRCAVECSSASRKKEMVAWSDSACADISSAVEESSSAALAFR
jgi:hypothetical protein